MLEKKIIEDYLESRKIGPTFAILRLIGGMDKIEEWTKDQFFLSFIRSLSWSE